MMKTLKLALTVLISASLLPTASALERPERRGSLMKKWIEKKRDERKVEALAGDVTSKLDVPYLDDQNADHRLDVYIPAKKDTSLTVLVHIHGGGWEIGDKKLMKTTGLFYASQGVLFITPNYRLSPKAQHPAHVEDCAAAVAWAFKHAAEYGGDRARVFVSGHSAGAHLTALLATDPTYLKKYGLAPTDLAGVIPDDAASYDLADANNEAIVKKFIRDSFGTDPAVLKAASPFYAIAAGNRYPSFLILNTTNRASAAAAAKTFADAFKRIGGDVRFVTVDNHTHAEMASGMYSLSDPVGKAIFEFLSHPSQK